MADMRVLVIRHHDIDDAGFIGAAFAARGAELCAHLVPDDGPLPVLDEKAGQDPARFLAQTIAQEPAAAQRADRLVAAALRLAAPGSPPAR
jgi:pimeloyl-ACP methyl ester carboxylesterase